METLALTALVNHETAVGSRGTAVPPAHIPLPTAVRRLPSLFITFAVEIEGHACTGSFAALDPSGVSPAQDAAGASLYFFAEAVDD